MDLQVSEKRAVSLYGLNRFPFTLYRDEWRAVFEARDVILSYIATHHVGLSCRCSFDAKLEVRRWVESGEVPMVQRHGPLWCRRATTGAVSLYGLRRFPVTLYCDQWLRVLDRNMQAWVEVFIRANDERLSTKGASVPRASKSSTRSGVRTFVDENNIIRPIAAKLRNDDRRH